MALKLNKICIVCQKPFYARPCQLKEGMGKYCSQKCYWATSPKIRKVCQICGKGFDVQQYRKGAKFCSLKCYGKAQQGQWRGGISKTKAYRKEFRQKWMSNPKNKLRSRVTTAIGNSLRSNRSGRSWEKLVGYTLVELKAHLESQFLTGMCWGNWGRWHIDHIKPVSSFNFSKPEDPDFKHCWALENMQPLWARKNLRKSFKLDYEGKQNAN